MKNIRYLACMALVALAGGLAGPAGAGASATAGPAVHLVNLHSARVNALRSTKPGPATGIVPTFGARRKAATAAPAAACSEPDCPLAWQRGPVQHSPQVYLLFWGPNWTNTDPVFNYLNDFFKGLGTASDHWSPVTSQYGDGTGSPSFGSGVFNSAWIDNSTPPDPVSQGDLAAEADALASKAHITDTADAQVVVVSQSGTCFATLPDGGNFAGNCGAPQSGPGYCAYHSYDGTIPYTNLPYLPDAGIGCGKNLVNAGSAGTYDGFSIVGGHEYAETVTDPQAGSGWIDLRDTSGGEIGDKCAWGGAPFGLHDPIGNISLSTGTYAMQSLWSNGANRCVLPGLIVDQLTLRHPANQRTVVHRLVNLRMHATSSTGSPLTWTITGQPPGLRITQGGLITGRPRRVGTWHVKVTVHDVVGLTATARWTWTIIH